MSIRSKILIPSVVLVAAAAMVGSGQMAAAADAPIPFRASYSGAAAFTSSTTVVFNGSGVATLIGESTDAGHATITGSSSACPGGLANVHQETLTAQNGDQLVIASQNVACPVSPGVYHGTGNWAVTGGTGRFTRVAGQGTFDGHGDFNVGKFVYTLDGAITISQ